MRVFIVGGTSGIGLAIATYYLQQGQTVAISGRMLSRVDPNLMATYPALSLFEFDIGNQNDVKTALQQFGEQGLDLVIVSAGFYFNSRHAVQDEQTTLRMLQTNVSGLNYVFEQASRIMLQQGYGHLAAIASIAGLVKSYPSASLYSATKKLVIEVCNTYRTALKPFSISVTTIVPGYVNTAKLRALNNGDASHKRFIVSEDVAIKQIVNALKMRRALLIFPTKLAFLVAVINLLPAKIRQLLL